MLAFILAALMTTSMTTIAFAAQPVENQADTNPYVEDSEPPVVTGVSLDKTTIKAGETVTLTLDAHDNISGVKWFLVDFRNPATDEVLSTSFVYPEHDNNLTVKITTDKNITPGEYHLYYIDITDNADNHTTYLESSLPCSLTLTVENDNPIDKTPPVVNGLTVDKTTYEAGEFLKVTLDAEDPSGIATFSAMFQNKDTLQDIVTDFTMPDDPLHGQAKINEFLVPGEFELVSITVEDSAGNHAWYSSDNNDELPEVKFTVTNSKNGGDVTPPVLYSGSLNKDTVYSGETFEMTIKADDDLSGIAYFVAIFINPENERRISVPYSSVEELTAQAYINAWEPSGTFYLDSIMIQDKAGNTVYYVKNVWDDRDKKLPFDLSITVINDDNKPDLTPSTPDKNSSGNSSIVNYESEKPDPADKEAVEFYNFWQNAKAKVCTTPDGKTMRLFVPKDITYMPASMMETLYRDNITLIITHDGKKITIPAGKAMKKQPLKVYWTFESLEKIYNA